MNLLQYVRLKILDSIPRRRASSDEKQLFLNAEGNPKLLTPTGAVQSVIVATPDIGTTDNAIARTDGATGAMIQNSDVLIDDSGNITTVNAIRFVLVPTVSHIEGQIHWNDTDKTLEIDTNETDVALQVGQEMYIRAVNDTGAPLADGTPVYISGVQGQRPKVNLADASSAATSRTTIGLATHTIGNNNTGFITTFGLVRGLDTTAWTEGDILYISTTAGQLTNVAPTPPDEIVRIGIVLYSHATQGIIFVQPASW